MTIRELNEWAKEHNVEDFKLLIREGEGEVGYDDEVQAFVVEDVVILAAF